LRSSSPGKVAAIFLQALQSFVLQRILQENLGLHDEIFEGLHLPWVPIAAGEVVTLFRR